jgi:pyruvate dehydrogenase (quinone)/pyruvate oxidase
LNKTAADILVEHLIEAEVEVVFGLPGDGINGVMEALRTRRDKIRFIQCRHEEAAALAAVGYAKFSGKLGVCLATTGPGAIHLLNGAYDAQADQVPLLVITGLPYHDLIGTFYQQDVATDRLFSEAALFSERIMGPLHVKTVIDQAIRTALSRRGVAHIAFPNDFQEKTVEEDRPSKMNQPVHTTHRWSPTVVVPTAPELQRAAEILNAGKKVVILAGAGARGATDELLEIAELLGAPIAKALLGKDVVPDDSPFTTGTAGVIGSSATAKAMQQADTLFLIGTSFPYISYLPKPERVRCVQIDVNPERISLRFPAEVGLVGDARQTLRLLLPLLHRNEDRSFLDMAQAEMERWRELMHQRGTAMDLPMRPQVAAWHLGEQLDDDAIICGDSGQNTLFAARHINIRGTQRFSCSGLLATMGCGLTYAIGAQLAFPHRQVVAFVGDGGFTMVLGELATCVKYHLPIKIVVLKNNVLGMIRWEQMMFLGNPEYGVKLQNIDFVKAAEAFGVKAFHLEHPEDAEEAIYDLLTHPGPALLQAVVDPFEPLMPGQIKPEQASNYAEALKKGQPNAHRIGLTLFRDAVEDLTGNGDTLTQAVEAARKENGDRKS